MAAFFFRAVAPDGKLRTGSITGESDKSVARELRRQGLTPIYVGTAPRKSGIELKLPVLGRRRRRDVLFFTQELSTLLNSGVPLDRALTITGELTERPAFRYVVLDVLRVLKGGKSLGDSLATHPEYFSDLFVNMVRAGEASGTLDLVLERLADFYEGQQAMKMKIRAAMAYPVLMFFIGSAVLLFLVAFVVPRITEIFAEMHQTLPAVTVFLIAVSGFLKNFWWLVLIVLAGAVGAIRYAVTKTVQGQYAWDRLKITVPLVGPVNRKIALARFSRTLGTLLQGGVPLLAAMDIVENIVDNRLISDEIKKAKRDVEEGQSLSAPLTRSDLFPPIVTEMISVGEQSGTMEKMLFRISDAYDREVETGILMMTSLLEPVMILVMGMAVGFIVVSILLPVFEMNQLVR